MHLTEALITLITRGRSHAFLGLILVADRVRDQEFDILMARLDKLTWHSHLPARMRVEAVPNGMFEGGVKLLASGGRQTFPNASHVPHTMISSHQEICHLADTSANTAPSCQSNSDYEAKAECYYTYAIRHLPSITLVLYNCVKR